MKTELDRVWMSTASIPTAVVEEGRRKGEVRETAASSNDLHALEKFVARLRKAHGRQHGGPRQVLRLVMCPSCGVP